MSHLRIVVLDNDGGVGGDDDVALGVHAASVVPPRPLPLGGDREAGSGHGAQDHDGQHGPRRHRAEDDFGVGPVRLRFAINSVKL